jgi:hypothetical protein
VALLKEFLAEFPEAEARLGKWRRRGLAEHYLKASGFESGLASAGPLARAFALAPRYSARRLWGRATVPR